MANILDLNPFMIRRSPIFSKWLLSQVVLISLLGLNIKANEKPAAILDQDRLIAAQMIKLVTKCINTELPDTFPKSIESRFQSHVISDYNSGDWKFRGRGFFDYYLYKEKKPELYKELRDFWSPGPCRIAHAIPALGSYYLEEKDLDVKQLLSNAISEIVNECAGENDKDMSFLYPALVNLLKQDDYDNSCQWLWEAVWNAMNTSQTAPYMELSEVLKRDINKCSRIRSEMMVHASAGNKRKMEKEMLLLQWQMVESSTCVRESRLGWISVLTGATKQNVEPYKTNVLAWLDDSLKSDSSDCSYEYLRFLYVKVGMRENLIPFLVLAIHSRWPRVSYLALDYLPSVTGINITLAEYSTFKATHSWEAPPLIKNESIRNDNTEEEKRSYEDEHKKAIEYWDKWWADHSPKYQESVN